MPRAPILLLSLAAIVVGMSCAGGGRPAVTVDAGAAADAGPSHGPGGGTDAPAGAPEDAAGERSPPTDTTGAPTDAGGAADSLAAACGVHVAAADLCRQLPRGTIAACRRDAAGRPSSDGYLEISGASPDGALRYACATHWSPSAVGGYDFPDPGHLMTDAASCCGGPPTPAVPAARGAIGTMHAPKKIKPQETAQPAAGLIRGNPFAVAITGEQGTRPFFDALATWRAWSGDGQPHPAPDGSGAYYFPRSVLVNYTVLEAADGALVVVIGPEVSLTADGKTPLGHPTLGGCADGGGAPLVLIAGELRGTTLTNHSGRFGYDPAETRAVLDDVAKLFNCLGIRISATIYYAPTP